MRKALRFVERELDMPRPLIEQEFLTDGIDLFLEYYGKLVNASRAGQSEIRSLLEARVSPRGGAVAMRIYPACPRSSAGHGTQPS